MWPTPTKPDVSVGKLFFRFIDAENAEILSSKMIYHCFLLICDNYWPVSQKVFWRLMAGFVGMGHTKWTI